MSWPRQSDKLSNQRRRLPPRGAISASGGAVVVSGCAVAVISLALSCGGYHQARGASPASATAPTGDVPRTLGDGWRQRAHAALTLPASEELAAARSSALEKLHALTAALNAIPEGADLARSLRTSELARQLESQTPAVEVTTGLIQGLRVRRPGEVQARINDLRRAFEHWAALATFDATALSHAHAHVDTLAEWDASASYSADDEATLRSAFGALARSHRLDDLLAEARQALSQPNQHIIASGRYLEEAATRSLVVPIDVVRSRAQATINVSGRIPLRTSLSLVPDDRHAALAVEVHAGGSLSLRAKRGKIRVFAQSRLALDAASGVTLGADGVRFADLDPQFSSRTRLTGVDAQFRFGNCLVERVIAAIARRKLPDADRSAAVEVEAQLVQRAEAETADIAYRINGLFQKLYFGPLAAEDIRPVVSFQTTADEIRWQAMYARHDQLAALSPNPALAASTGEMAFTFAVHESALNNLSDALGGARLDEATFVTLLRDELKLQAAESDHPAAPRVPAAIHLASDDPVNVRFHEDAVLLTLRLAGIESEAGRFEPAAHTLTARYRVELNEGGLTVSRDEDVTCEPAADEGRLATMVRFLPQRLRFGARHHNTSFPQALRMAALELDRGWLVAGAARAAGEAPHMAGEPHHAANNSYQMDAEPDPTDREVEP